MRGKIIHYNAEDGRGLISTDGRQIPFEIGQWRSDTAPAINQVVDATMNEDTLESVTRVAEEVLLKEKAGQLASKLGSAGGAALQSLKDSAPADGSAASGLLQMWGKPLLIAYGLFAVSALALTYLSTSSLYGSRGFTLVGISKIAENMGASVGSAFWTWLAIVSIALPVLWKSRWAWLALLLPLLATIKPFLDLAIAARKTAKQMQDFLGADAGSQVMNNLLEMIETGIGFWVCLASALFIAAIGLKRVLLPPTR